jgi:amino acid transporter/predicted CoA-binding protein
MPAQKDDGLVRAIGARRLTASIVNVTIGAGIFVLPAIVVARLGTAAPLAYIVCAVLMALIVTCFASAGSRVSLTGGLYAYVGVAFGPFIGLVAGVLYGLMATFAAASVASAFAGSVGNLWGFAATPAGRAAALLVLFAVLAAINVRGVEPGSRLIEAVTVAKLAPLVTLVVCGLVYVGRYGLAHEATAGTVAAFSIGGVGRTAIVLIFAFVGVEVALVPSGEIRDPARTVPRALFSALAITTVLYLAIQYVAQAILGAGMSEFATAPLAEAARRILGPGGRLLMLAGAIVSMFGYVSGDMLGSPRALFALGRDGMLPPVFARVHPRFHTPHTAIAAYAVLVAALAISLSFTQLAVLANVAALSLYLLCVTGSWELRRRDVRMGGTPFVVPGGPVVPLLAVLVILWLLSQATRREFAVEAIVVAATAIVYRLRRYRGRSAAAYTRRMAHTNPSDSEITRLLTDATTIAIVGASSNPDKASYGIMQKLQRAGYQVIPVNPHETEILGERSYPSLVDIPGRIDIVDVFRRPEDAPQIADEAVTIGARVLWLQTGISSEDAAARAEAGGLKVVMDTCIGMTHAMLRIPPKITTAR